MSILPRRNGIFDCFPERNKVVERSGARIVFASDSCFRHIPMTVTQRIITLAVEFCVFRVGERGCM